MRRIETLKDVVDWGLCVGCGACAYFCRKSGISLVNIESVGIRPKIAGDHCGACNECLSICPGYILSGRQDETEAGEKDAGPAGPFLEICEGWAQDPELRYRASSGGVLTALSRYCLAREGMTSVLHTAMDPDRPWLNKTVLSRSGTELLKRCGSRYAPSSPCEGLGMIEKDPAPAVFIGKPCDVAAVARMRTRRPELNSKIGLLLSFFCAGPPCTQATLDLLKRLGIDPGNVNELHYRGNGWPGGFFVRAGREQKENFLPYQESWGFLSRYPRAFRCHLCTDRLGEYADISCGDAWHRYQGNGDPGRSLIIVRSVKGWEILRSAVKAEYVEREPSGLAELSAAQGPAGKRREIFGRLLAMKLLLVPTPQADWFSLFKEWLWSPGPRQIRSVLGMMRRMIRRGLWHRNPLFPQGNTPQIRQPSTERP